MCHPLGTIIPATQCPMEFVRVNKMSFGHRYLVNGMDFLR